MTFEQINSLLDRGFTPEQITTLFTTFGGPTPPDTVGTGAGFDPLALAPAPADNTPAADPPAPEPADNTPAADPPAPEPAGNTPAADPPASESNAAVLDAIADLKKSIQASNIKTMSVDTVDDDNALEKAMSEIIRPSLEKGV